MDNSDDIFGGFILKVYLKLIKTPMCGRCQSIKHHFGFFSVGKNDYVHILRNIWTTIVASFTLMLK